MPHENIDVEKAIKKTFRILKWERNESNRLLKVLSNSQPKVFFSDETTLPNVVMFPKLSPFSSYP